MNTNVHYGHALERLRYAPGFAGLGLGLRETCGRVTSEPAWRVYVRRKRPLRALLARERVPTRLLGMPTDVIEAAVTHCATHAGGGLQCAQSDEVPIEGSGIANGRGVPGSLGCVVWLRRTEEPVLLASYHVLFGRRCQRGDPIWAVGGESEATPQIIGRVLSGKAGVVVGFDPPTFVDAATGTLVARSDVAISTRVPAATAQPRAGDIATKRGAATGWTCGVVVDVAYPDLWYWEYQSANAPRQILIRPTDGHGPFSVSGDSGAVVRNARGELLGLLWGTTARGEGVASPINAVARALGLRFANASTASDS